MLDLLCRQFRVANLSIRLMARTRVSGIAFFAACLACYYYVRLGSCLSWLASTLGYAPMHIVMTALVILVLYVGTPLDPAAQDALMQARPCRGMPGTHLRARGRLLPGADLYACNPGLAARVCVDGGREAPAAARAQQQPARQRRRQAAHGCRAHVLHGDRPQALLLQPHCVLLRPGVDGLACSAHALWGIHPAF